MTKDEIIKEINRCNQILAKTKNKFVKRDYGKYKKRLLKELRKDEYK